MHQNKKIKTNQGENFVIMMGGFRHGNIQMPEIYLLQLNLLFNKQELPSDEENRQTGASPIKKWYKLLENHQLPKANSGHCIVYNKKLESIHTAQNWNEIKGRKLLFTYTACANDRTRPDASNSTIVEALELLKHSCAYGRSHKSKSVFSALYFFHF